MSCVLRVREIAGWKKRRLGYFLYFTYPIPLLDKHSIKRRYNMINTYQIFSLNPKISRRYTLLIELKIL